MSDQQQMTIPTPADAAEIEQILAWLDQTPRRIAELVQEHTQERLQARPDPETWSANDILAHLRACADVWGKSIRVLNPSKLQVLPKDEVLKRIAEYDQDNTLFGLASGLDLELGYFALSELASVTGPLGMPIERDEGFTPTMLRALMALHEGRGGES
jgi:hypothetical protein